MRSVAAYIESKTISRASGNRRGLRSEQAIPDNGQKRSDGQVKTEYELESESSGRDAVPCVRKRGSIPPMEWNRGFDAMMSTNYNPHPDVLKL